MTDQQKKRSLAVIVANWNGEAWIERCLGSVFAAARRIEAPVEIIVYDDASEDRSPGIVAAHYPGVRLIRGARNVGYGAAVNAAMAASASDWVFLLNNDLALQTDFCERLLLTLREFENQSEKEQEKEKVKEIFAISARTRDWTTQQINHGGQRALFRSGLLWQTPFETETAAPADFFQAGACLIDRRKFLALGGFSPLFHPGYWEDYDLAWQARDRGWQVFYEPRAVAWHLGKGSMRRKLGAHGVSLALRRNHLLFNWLNLRGPSRLCAHFLALPLLMIRDDAPTGEAGWGRAFFSALRRLPAALAERRRRFSI